MAVFIDFIKVLKFAEVESVLNAGTVTPVTKLLGEAGKYLKECDETGLKLGGGEFVVDSNHPALILKAATLLRLASAKHTLRIRKKSLLNQAEGLEMLADLARNYAGTAHG